MKYLYLILSGLLTLATATYAEGIGNADRMSVSQTGEITVKGKVVDENGESLPGATVQQKGTSHGVVTDIDGNFSISVPSDATLVVSYVGYKSAEVNVGGKNNLGNIMLASEIQELEQVVVIGYGTQRKVDLTGSVAIVNTEEMKKVSHSIFRQCSKEKFPVFKSHPTDNREPILPSGFVVSVRSAVPHRCMWWMEYRWEQPYATFRQTISKRCKYSRMHLLQQSMVRVLPMA
jgi:hypothetical protein